MENRVSKNVREIPPSGIRKLFDVANEMKGVISLGVGEPDFITPWNIREAAISSIERGRTHYTSNKGLPELRELISVYLKERFGVNYSADDTLITVGASEGLDLVFRAVLEPGDEVLVPAPSYVSYMPGVRLAYGVPVPVVTCAEDNFVLQPEAIEAAVTKKTKAIVLPYPNNPTGAIMTREQLDRIIPVIEKHDLLIIADEIYAELTYGTVRHASVAKGLEERTVLISGFSKSLAMTGWRLGYACAPKEILDAMVKIHQYTMLCAPIMAQYAGLEALKTEMESGYMQIREMRHSYNRRRILIYEGFNEMGLSCFEPKGAFYVFPSIQSTGMTSDEFCTKLLMSKKVACVDGSAFGSVGEGFIRCSYAASVENITEALKRIKEFLEEIK
ncbi:MAG: aminotransferase class I/II-fold pyridoxal phosphate-dependent enzyme [Christensenellaceae bacterium]|nr:aminotransferase class I/II-fold pyridoxal phosphate-dependent enzyme [Christensenellaceae bacterium]MBR3842835.1 aminotransferase class I/II-fold pyridoxal phosphate-dependent enzyme [Christensenellaceae bacterium]